MPAFNATGVDPSITLKKKPYLNQLYYDALVFTPYTGGGELAAELVSAVANRRRGRLPLVTLLRRAARGLGRVQGRIMRVRRA
jgi:hypothetical protein